MHIVIDDAGDDVRAVVIDPSGTERARHTVRSMDWPDFVRHWEREKPRWAWDRTDRWYPRLLGAGIRIARALELHTAGIAIDRSLHRADAAQALADPELWAEERLEQADPDRVELFSIFAESDSLARFHEIDARIRASREPERLRLLAIAESTGTLIAAEIKYDGLPWDLAEHDRVLRERLGPRPAFGGPPARMEALGREIRVLLGRPDLNPDSPQDLLRALHGAGLAVESTSKWELASIDHPAIGPVLAYKSMHRLLTAHGWHWADTWVRGGRFRPEYVPGGAWTGRWTSRGGGALQIPAIVRGAVLADEGWTLVVADAAQVEPRIIAAMSADPHMAAAGQASDLYQALVDRGVVAERGQAKIAMLGALYGATTGESAKLLPRLRRAYPRALALVDEAAATGERGGQVHSWLGRTSPPPNAEWRALQSAAAAEGASTALTAQARQRAREWGRFTRNFIAQSTAAEWALCWLGGIRARLAALGGPAQAHLVYFLHDEIIVHCRIEHADAVAVIVREAATEAGRILFGTFPVDFPLSVATARSYADAGKGAGAPVHDDRRLPEPDASSHTPR